MMKRETLIREAAEHVWNAALPIRLRYPEDQAKLSVIGDNILEELRQALWEPISSDAEAIVKGKYDAHP